MAHVTGSCFIPIFSPAKVLFLEILGSFDRGRDGEEARVGLRKGKKNREIKFLLSSKSIKELLGLGLHF